MARAIWKAALAFGDVKLPVKMYSAVEDRTVHFNLLHDQDMVRLQQRMVNSETGKVVEAGDRRKGYEIERGVFVLLDDDELRPFEPEPSRDIEILQFVDDGAIHHQWYDRPYYLGPDENDSDYFAFAAALEPLEKEGVARWTMRKQEYVGSLRAEEGYLMLMTLRHAGEVIEASDLTPPSGRALDKKEMKMAIQLVEMLKDDFEPDEYRDEYRKSVLELIDKKRTGKKVRLEKPRTRKHEPDSLAAALRASLAKAT